MFNKNTLKKSFFIFTQINLMFYKSINPIFQTKQKFTSEIATRKLKTNGKNSQKEITLTEKRSIQKVINTLSN